MPLTTDDRQFLKRIYRDLDDRPLEPGDPRYQPPYQHEGCEDPILLLQNSIEFADGESLNLFPGFAARVRQPSSCVCRSAYRIPGTSSYMPMR